MYFVYILQSQVDSSYYTGQTKDIEKRLIQHNTSARKSTYTYKKRPWVLIHKEEYGTRSDAMKRETYLKNVKNKNYIAKIINSRNL